MTQSTLTALPTDVLTLLLAALDDVQALAALAQTCSLFHALVSELGWSTYARLHPRPSHSLTAARRRWDARVQLRYDVLADRAWRNTEPFIARPLARTWPGKFSPTLAASPSRLVVAAGATLFSYAFGLTADQPSIAHEATLALSEPSVRGRNITSICFLDDGGLDQTLLVGYQEHLLEIITLEPVVRNGHHSLTFRRSRFQASDDQRLSTFPFPRDDYIEDFATSGHHLLAISANGSGRLVSQKTLHDSFSEISVTHPLSTPPPSSTSEGGVELNERSWSCHLSTDASTPFAAFGSSGKTPLTVHNALQDGSLSTSPSAILLSRKTATQDSTQIDIDKLPLLAVYGITRAPLASPFGASPQILVSGWFDGRVRIYDLRCSESRDALPTSNNNNNQRSPQSFLRPVLSMTDRWSYESIYAVSCGGGSSAHIAAGTARHSVVSFWDSRAPKNGWSVHAPGNDRSPVFSVVLESSRVFGATDSRPFVYDFGPDPKVESYPPLIAPAVSSAPTRGQDREGLKHTPGLVTYRVTKYAHASSGLCQNEH